MIQEWQMKTQRWRQQLLLFIIIIIFWVSVHFLQNKIMVQKWSATVNLITSLNRDMFFTSQVQIVSPTLHYGPKCPVFTIKEVKRRQGG